VSCYRSEPRPVESRFLVSTVRDGAPIARDVRAVGVRIADGSMQAEPIPYREVVPFFFAEPLFPASYRGCKLSSL